MPNKFLADHRGNVAIIFALVLSILLAIAGLAVDYAVAVHRKKSMDAALDIAILAGAKAAAEARQKGEAEWQLIGELVMHRMFRANLPPGTNYVPRSLGGNIKVDGTKFTATATYTGHSLTTFMSMFGFDQVALKGTAKATLSAANFVDIHFVIDGSASMGIGATNADQQAMLDGTTRLYGIANRCAFACHQRPATGPNYSPAKMHTFIKPDKRPVELRIDIVRGAIQNVLRLIQEKNPNAGNVRVALHLFSNKLATILPLTSNLGSSVASAGAIDLVSGQGGGSYISYSMRTLAESLGTAGDGTAENKRASYVVLLSDGIDDSVIATQNGAITYTRDMAKWMATNPSRQSPDTSWMQPFNTGPCQTLKDKGHRVLTVQIKYLMAVGLRPWPDVGKVDLVTGELAQPLVDAFKACSTNKNTDYRLAANTDDIAPVLQKIVNDVVIPDVVHLSQ